MRVHLDHNATTPLRAEAREAWLAALDAGLGNPSSVHEAGRRARHAIDDARERVAAALGVVEDEVLFTSGGTEAINLALRGHLAARGAGAMLASPGTEHAAVRETAADLARGGHPHRPLAVDREGELDPVDFERAAAHSGLALVALSAGNHEIGTAHDLAHARERLPAGVTLFADGVQALGRLPLDLSGWGVDLAAFSAHKVGGPPGVGVLVVRDRTPLVPLMTGGGQERGLRPGTESAAAIVAAAVAIELAVLEREDFERRTRALARGLLDTLTAASAAIELVGPPLERARRLANTLCLVLGRTLRPRTLADAPGDAPADGKVLVTRLDLEGVAVSAGSACASGALEPSPVLLALGLDEDRARSALRVSLGRTTTAEDCQRAARVMVSILAPSHASGDGASPL